MKENNHYELIKETCKNFFVIKIIFDSEQFIFIQNKPTSNERDFITLYMVDEKDFDLKNIRTKHFGINFNIKDLSLNTMKEETKKICNNCKYFTCCIRKEIEINLNHVRTRNTLNVITSYGSDQEMFEVANKIKKELKFNYFYCTKNKNKYEGIIKTIEKKIILEKEIIENYQKLNSLLISKSCQEGD